MGKTINVTYKDKAYTLEFNRRTIETVEKWGFSREKIDDMPVTMIPLLVRGAFLMHHRNMKVDLIEEIYDNIRNKSDFLVKLIQMYAEPALELLANADEEEDTEKNGEWGADW